MVRKVLEYAYKNDFVDTSDFSKNTLRKYEKAGLLKYKRTVQKGRDIYWLTKKGLKCYRGQLPKSRCKV